MKSENVKFRKQKALIISVLFLMLAFAIVSIGCASSADLNDGLVAYYPFNGNANDESGNGYNGTVDGATLTTDRFGNASSAYYFDGNDDFIYAPVNINPDIMPSMTMSAWVRADEDSSIRQVISHDNRGYDRSLGIDSRGGGIGWSAFSGSGDVLGYSPVTIGEWVFVAVVYDQNVSTVKLYVNDTIYEGEGNLGSGLDYIHIGSNPSHAEYFAGAIDEVRIYNYALNQSEIKEDMEKCTLSTLLSLAEAVDNSGLTWFTGGDADWSGQKSTYYYDGAAAQSGNISHNQSTWIQTMVSGPGNLSFYWNVSSEANSDSLEFYIDCIKQDSISGDVNWEQKSYDIGPGLHTLMWKYRKNESIDGGLDCGWLDKVTFSAGSTLD
ncbi:MAG: hypothetical protein GQ523_12270 [Methanophagales archaeon]|jgi:hypothetical protein|nr:hypothetical protein [Methanophagales archaeon]